MSARYSLYLESDDDIITFGKKHRGKSVAYVLANDPGFLLWWRDTKASDEGLSVDKLFSRHLNDKLEEARRAKVGFAAKFKSIPYPETKGESISPVEVFDAPAESVTAELVDDVNWGTW